MGVNENVWNGEKMYGTGIKGVCDCNQPLTILFFTISVMCCLNAFSDLSVGIIAYR